MAKSKRLAAPGRSARKKYDLSNIHETSSTVEGVVTGPARGSEFTGSYEEIAPPFQGGETKKEKNSLPHDVGFWLKIFGSIIAFIITVGGPIVWYASRLNTNVDVLQNDVKEVKTKTDKLLENSIRQSERIDKIESIVDAGKVQQSKKEQK